MIYIYPLFIDIWVRYDENPVSRREIDMQMIMCIRDN
jgi:hypothetical protein